MIHIKPLAHFRVPTEFQKHNSMINDVISLMHGLNLPLLAAASSHREYLCHAATIIYLNKHACTPCMNFEIIET